MNALTRPTRPPPPRPRSPLADANRPLLQIALTAGEGPWSFRPWDRRKLTVAVRETTLCRLAALAVLVIGAIHFELWLRQGYRDVHVIGPLFFANAVAAVLIAVVLVFRAGPGVELAALVFASSTLAAFLISVYHGLFGFVATRHGSAQTVSLMAEGAAILLLSAALARRTYRDRLRRKR